MPTIDPDVTMSWFVYVVRLSGPYTTEDRTRSSRASSSTSAPAHYFPAIPTFPHFRDKYGIRAGDFPVAESVSQRTIALPMFVGLTEVEISSSARRSG